MSKKDEALKLALEALEWINRVNAMDFEYQRKARESLNAIYEALAEQPAQQQEPLEYWNAVEGWVKIDEVREHFDSVGCGTIYKTPGDGRVPLTTAHRKPLTDEQIEDIWADCPADWDDKINVLTLARAIEAAHGIKENT